MIKINIYIWSFNVISVVPDCLGEAPDLLGDDYGSILGSSL